MRNLKLVVLVAGSLLLGACSKTKEPQEYKNQEPEVQCKSGLCMQTMNWIMSFSKADFPENVEIRISNMKMLNECDPNSDFQVSREGDSVQVVIWDFMAMPPDRSFNVSLGVKDLGNCYEEPKDYYYKAVQEYSVQSIQNRRHVIINQTN